MIVQLRENVFRATHKDWKELEWFSNKGYIVAYSDNHAEVPQEVISVYKQVNTPELQEKCRKLSWMRSCESMMGLIYAIAPLKIVYRMYRKRDGFRVSYEEFMDILNELAENDAIGTVYTTKNSPTLNDYMCTTTLNNVLEDGMDVEEALQDAQDYLDFECE